MFKLTLKLMTLTALMMVAFLGMSSTEKVAAATCNWAPGNPNNPPAMGFHHGEADDNFSGLVVKAYVGAMTNGAPDDTGHGGQKVNVGYMLHSRLPPINPGEHYYNPANSQNVNARIFTLNSNGQPIDRTDARTFRTGETLYGPGSSFNCDGFSALGPGTFADEIGNRFGIDCGQEVLRDGTNAFIRKEMSRYWIDNIPNAFNQQGYWEIQIKNPDGSVSRTFNNGDMGGLNSYFTVANGDTKYVDLVWHKDPEKTRTYGSGACTFASITTDNNWFGSPKRTHVEITGISLGRARVNDNPATDTTYGPYTPNPSGWPPGDPGGGGRPGSVDAYVPDPNGQTSGNTSKQWYFLPWNSTSVKIKKTTQAWVDGPDQGSAPDHWEDKGTEYYNGSGWQSGDTSISCYTGYCNVVSAYGDGPGGIVMAGGAMHVRATLTNTSRDDLQLWQPQLHGSNGGAYGTSAIVPSGGTAIFDFDMTAPNSVQNYGFNFRPIYFADIGSPCYGSVPVYEQFNVVPRANIINTDAENPTTVTYTSGGSATTGTITATTTSWLTKQPYGGAAATVDNHVTTDTYGSLDHTYTYNNPSINAGDLFCAYTNINPSSGYRGPSGNIYTTSDTRQSGCVKTVNRPYVHLFGNDVTAGGGFGDSCNKDQKGVIYAYSNAPGGVPNAANKGGAGTQFGAHAMEIISGLSSANLRKTAPLGLSGLSFANTEHIGGATPSKTTGGYLGDAALSNFCVPDYFSDKPTRLASDPNTPLTESTNTTAQAGAGNAQQWYKPGGGTGTLNLSGGTIANGVNQVIFVEGNVRITGNITYSGAARGSVKDIPSFFLIVKNGNIRIDPSVTQLDGAYIAQPDASTTTKLNQTGIINTCYIGNSFNDVYNQCKNQLTINGAFVANRVLLARSYSSLRYSQSGENNLGGATHNCGNVNKDVPAGATSARDCAAEIFNFSPELYMSQPSINARFGAPSGKFDAITSLSPVL